MATLQQLFGEEITGEAIVQNEIVASSVDVENRKLRLKVNFSKLVTNGLLNDIKKKISKKLQLGTVELEPVFMPELFSEKYMEQLFEQTRQEVPTANGFFNGAETVIDGRNLNIILQNGGSEILMNCGSAEFIKKRIKQLFGIDINLTFTENETKGNSLEEIQKAQDEK